MEHSQGTGAGLLLAGRYRLGETIGRGGMGKVWRAHDEVLHRVVAVKELTAGRFVAEADRLVLHARTQKEARAAARITHPGVVTVHDVLEHDARPWIVMQYVDGPSLADAAKESGTVEPREAARIGLHVLGALRAAHAAGVLHRDVKPGNILLARDGRVLITDFGIAAIEGDSTITRTGEIVGSIDYLAPERVKGADPGPASDLWSLGATLYTAVEGTSPFRRTSPISTMQAVVTEEPPHPEKAGALTPVIVALLRKDPAQRPRADEVGRMLLEAMEGRAPTSAQAYVPTQRVAKEDLDPAEATDDRDAPTSTASTASAADRERQADRAPRSEAGAAETAGTASRGSTAQWPQPPQALQQPQQAHPSRPPTPVPGPAHPPSGRGRRRTVVLAALLAGLVAGGAVFAAMHYAGGDRDADGTGGTPIATAPPATPSAKDEGKNGIPAGWHRVEDPEGFSLLVPDGWKRQTEGDQIDYTPDNGNHRIRISIDRNPDFENPYMHALDLERVLAKRMDYTRIKLLPTTYRDQTLSCLWEFSWTEKKTFPGPRRAIDQMYYGDDGTEYAIYMSSPESSWETTREQFDIVLRHWREAGERGEAQEGAQGGE
ncbi:serine/threonine protein kinase [Streptomyces cinereoruber]|uniref:non-specific serine/threonine protein kinase n=1 Tax=Streptomyces cinereoruber TaxID=67260 RepID=A0AAV4KD73_9ACTN|nr:MULTISPECIES: serine/threonine-protein kinase [Streptomyces]AVH95922.1 serine/threonine protein kinase [Streptomyces sp. WAC00288]MBB4157093.1 serine/threonine protein kinase [Streptomyces cinereoruber]MBY8815088.1 serine/threonine protein kinase [Streptomyces cinereoruber]NIH59809.1 serine/threonine protein kinase [Streptomyces cinereoruber]QEV34331.1 serine/threonine protein kinase [Streptomyces cinereoruber]